MRILGVLVNQRASFPPVSQILFCKKLSTWGHRLGMMVIVFTPDGINWTLNKVNGYAYDAFTRQWLMNQYPLPRYIYDRFFCYNLTEYRRYRQLNQVLSRNPQINYLGNSLGNKWYVHQMISKEPSFIRYLPHSEPYLHHKQLQQRLMNREDIFVKPRSGSQGKGVLKIERNKTTIQVVGRDHNNLPIEQTFTHVQSFLQWFSLFAGRRKYMIQPYLPLTTSDGIAYDVRVLVQKNHLGRWQITGMTIRKGQPGSVTSNLHGGGEVEDIHPFLSRLFGERTSEKLTIKLGKLAIKLSSVIEFYHGRLLELGIDFGIDRSGHIWILEVNSKPGRKAFSKSSSDSTSSQAIINPLRYTKYLMDRQFRRLT